jgi:hypothetical protein
MTSHKNAAGDALKPGIDIRSTMLAVTAALVLLGLSSSSGSPIPLIAAAGIAVYVLAVPLRLHSILTSREFGLRLARFALLLIAAAVCLALLAQAVNSGIGIVMTIGTLGMIAVLASLGVLVVRFTFLATCRAVAFSISTISAQLSQWRTTAVAVLRHSLRSRSADLPSKSDNF